MNPTERTGSLPEGRAGVAQCPAAPAHCEWCGKRGGVGRTFEADWREHHGFGDVVREMWFVCDEACEGELRRHLEQTLAHGARWPWGLLFRVAMVVGVFTVVAGFFVLQHLLTTFGVAERVAERIALHVAAVVFAAVLGAHLGAMPIWLWIPKPSRARLMRLCVRTSERIMVATAWVFLTVALLGYLALGCVLGMGLYG